MADRKLNDPPGPAARAAREWPMDADRRWATAGARLNRARRDGLIEPQDFGPGA